jgi:metal-responsive CopG/Arc/MetJ family transcriptional regulator
VRTTIELDNESRAKLMALAAKRGLRGYSELVQEAVTEYLAKEEQREQAVQEVMELSGSLSADEAKQVEEGIEATWKCWSLPTRP